MGRLSGKRVIITGAAAGIGRAAARRFAAEGARLALVDLRADEGEALVRELRSSGAEALFFRTDVGDPAAMEAAVSSAAQAFGGLDVLYNNAGGATRADGRVTDIDLEEFWRAVRVDLFGTFLGCRFAIPYMQRSGGGSIINTASIRALVGTAGADAYTAAKGGVVALTRALALQWAPAKIRVNAVAPGVVLTERVRALLREDDPIRRKTPLGPGEPEDIAELAVFLASDESRFLTGAILPADGGASAV
ncbi:MAG: SDR family oxidoreductase [Burkholderiales bacterium]|nr:SDR family oxidoreductase [Burkholderiales bacterium]